VAAGSEAGLDRTRLHPWATAPCPPRPPAPPPRYKPAAHDDAFAWPRGLGEGDDGAWADRLWEDMLRRRRAAAAAAAARGFGSGGAAAAAAAAAAERRRRAEAAAAESARILGEERAKDADWRAAMLRQVAEVRGQGGGRVGRRAPVWGAASGAGSCCAPTHSAPHHLASLCPPAPLRPAPRQAALPARRGDYEAAWAALDARLRAAPPGGAPLGLADVPWPIRALAAAARRGAGAAELEAAAGGEAARGELRDLVLHDAR
jgi:hypothetical protein